MFKSVISRLRLGKNLFGGLADKISIFFIHKVDLARILLYLFYLKFDDY